MCTIDHVINTQCDPTLKSSTKKYKHSLAQNEVYNLETIASAEKGICPNHPKPSLYSTLKHTILQFLLCTLISLL